jgi:acyl-CoA reductase-like NAD-dependent aldehyde dehydrogenase
MTSHPGFAKISFTGSSETGKRVMASAAKDLKRLTLELGGNDAAIVLPDVNVDEIAAKIFFGAFANTSQICVATKRLYVHEDVYDALRDRLVAIAKMTKVGDGSEQGTVLGPIQNKRQYERVVDLLESAKSDGLKLLQGSDIPNSAGYFIPITIVDKLAIERAFSVSALQTAPASPYSLSLARRTTSSTSLNFIIGRIGPKASSWTTREDSGGLSTMVIGMK